MSGARALTGKIATERLGPLCSLWGRYLRRVVHVNSGASGLLYHTRSPDGM